MIATVVRPERSRGRVTVAVHVAVPAERGGGEAGTTPALSPFRSADSVFYGLTVTPLTLPVWSVTEASK